MFQVGIGSSSLIGRGSSNNSKTASIQAPGLMTSTYDMMLEWLVSSRMVNLVST